ncbi:membrane protein [Acidocella aquatica]|uniref:Membrane protein n=1 Tax=Acidocella aquatica TaxID=1922313 RepID=A0ABQ6A6J2_9PROT|nr:DUF6691 family protein [Acidocella aquatica]GLR67307.1 membrane protein [Acidocella aquatica]
MRPTHIFSAFAFGLILGAGLILSGMADPDRVKAFLDVSGAWNPSLALVMGGAIAVAAPAFVWAKRRRLTPRGCAAASPGDKLASTKLVLGAAIFGLGWGLSGICPGPGIVLLGYGARGAIIFAVTMVIGARLAGLFAPPGDA